MLSFLFLPVLFSLTYSLECPPKNYYWRPFNGTFGSDAFVAGNDDDGTENYVAKVVPLDQYLWTIPVQIKNGEKSIDFAWYNSNRVLKITKFIEILSVDSDDALQWTKVKKSMAEIADDCCFVPGGAGDNNGKFVPYIGRIKVNEKYFIGRVYLKEWTDIHVMDGQISIKYDKNYEVLTYNCKN